MGWWLALASGCAAGYAGLCDVNAHQSLPILDYCQLAADRPSTIVERSTLCRCVFVNQGCVGSSGPDAAAAHCKQAKYSLCELMIMCVAMAPLTTALHM